MTTQSKHSESKAAFVCPTCRIVFSLPKRMGGNAANCPGCEHLLVIPAEKDDVSIIGFSGTKYGNAAKKEGELHYQNHHRGNVLNEDQAWAKPPQDPRDKGLKLMVPIAIISVVIIGGLTFLMLTDSMVEKDEIINSGLSEDGLNKKNTIQDVITEEGYIYDAEDKDKVEELEKFLRSLFAAKTVDEMLPYVRPMKGIKEKMSLFYKENDHSQSPFLALLSAESITDFPGYLIFECQTEDFKIHTGILSYAEDQILLDWESYIGYSEMTWKELADKKPTKPVRLRVSAKMAFYYNEEFANEKDWQSVALTNPNEADALYGYVKRGSAAYQELFNFDLSNNRKVILEVYFPEGAKNGNQVYIERVVEQGWLLREDK